MYYTCKLRFPCCASFCATILLINSCIFLGVGTLGLYTIITEKQENHINNTQYVQWLSLLICVTTFSIIGCISSLIQCESKKNKYICLEEQTNYNSFYNEKVETRSKQTQIPILTNI